MVGRYPTLAPAVALYSGTIIVIALIAMRMLALSAQSEALARQARLGNIVLIAAAALTIVLSLFVPKWAMLGYLLNALEQPLRPLLQKRKVD